MEKSQVDMYEARSLEEEARSRGKIYLAHSDSADSIIFSGGERPPSPPIRDTSLNTAAAFSDQEYLRYNHSQQDSSYLSQDGDYSECYLEEGRTLLTKAELEQYTKAYEESLTRGSHQHQKQPSYAQSEGYHSYVSSSDSAIITPLLDRLRRENDVIVSSEDTAPLAGRESSASGSSGSSTDTLKWHGSLSDVSVASSYRSSGQLIAHSARVQTPQRHHSESVLYLSSVNAVNSSNSINSTSCNTNGTSSSRSSSSASSSSSSWQNKTPKVSAPFSNQLRKLYPVNTYTIQPESVTIISSSPAAFIPLSSPTFRSPPSLTVAERIIELEKQQQKQQNNQSSMKYTYFDPEKKHKVTDHNLKVIQKKALLSYYERHHSAWRSEPQLSPVPVPPQPPPRPRLPTPTTQSDSVEECDQESFDKENVQNMKQDERLCFSIANSHAVVKETSIHRQHSSSCGSLVANEANPMVMTVSEAVSVDDWAPELPPKKAHLKIPFTTQRTVSPDLPPPSPPPAIDDDYVSDEPLPPPPPEVLSSTYEHELTSGTKPKATSPPDLILSAKQSFEDNKNHQNRNNSETKTEEVNISCASHEKWNKLKSAGSKPSSPLGRKHSFEVPKYDYSEINKLMQKQRDSILSKLSEASMDYKRVKESFARSSIRKERSSVEKCADFVSRKSSASNFERQSTRCSLRNGEHNRNIAPGTHYSSKCNVIQNDGKYPVVKDRYAPLYEKHPHRDSAVVRNVQTSRRSEGFQEKLEPRRPSCQQSHSSYRREPREREKGVPNFEGSYKRTMSPGALVRGNSGANGTLVNGNARSVSNKATDNAEQKLSTLTELENCKGGKQCPTVEESSEVSDPSQPLCIRSESISNIELQRVPEFCQTLPRNYTLLPASSTQISTTVSATSNTAASSVNTTACSEGNKRCARTPRTQSDPSTLPSIKDTAPLPQSSSSLSLGKSVPTLSTTILRSQSDLSTTESGYSSLSLNLQSPSTSPTRLSIDRSGADTFVLEKKVTDGYSFAEVQCDIEPRDRKVIQRSEVIVRIGASTNDAASQTESVDVSHVESDHQSVHQKCSRDTSTSPILRQKLQEEIECEELSRDLVSHLSPNDKLHGILTPKPEAKTSMDYVSDLFRTNLGLRTRTPISSCGSSSPTMASIGSQSDDVKWFERNSPDHCAGNTVATKRVISNSSKVASSQSISSLQRKKEELVNRLDRKLNVLKEEQVAIMEECRVNEVLGEAVSKRVIVMASAHEAAKFKLHVQEIGHITSLLLGLSGRLARVENTLLELADDHRDREILEGKRDKLASQLEEAKALKENIDRRSHNIAVMLQRYFTKEEFADYDHFVNMKSKLLIDSKEISDKIQLGEEQLTALKETLSAAQ